MANQTLVTMLEKSALGSFILIKLFSNLSTCYIYIKT